MHALPEAHRDTADQAGSAQNEPPTTVATSDAQEANSSEDTRRIGEEEDDGEDLEPNMFPPFTVATDADVRAWIRRVEREPYTDGQFDRLHPHGSARFRGPSAEELARAVVERLVFLARYDAVDDYDVDRPADVPDVEMPSDEVILFALASDRITVV